MTRGSLLLNALVCSTAACATPDPDSGERRDPPELLASSPALDDTDVYPAPMWSAKGEEFVIALSFSEPMTLRGELVLSASEGSQSIANLAWSGGDTKLSLYARPTFSTPQPLLDDTEYWLDASPLVSATGLPLRPDLRLRERGLVFTTGRYDPLLNHSCGHTFFGPFQAIGSSTEAGSLAPDVSTTHVEYSVTLREGAGTYGGWIRARFPTQGPYRLYFDGDTPLRIGGTTDEARTIDVTATPRACPGITHEATLAPAGDEETFLYLGPTASPVRRMIVELVSEQRPGG